MKYALQILLLSIISTNTFSGELAYDATIELITNTSSGGPDFSIMLGGGSGPCANNVVKFPENKQASEASNQQAFSIALTALTTGKKVRVHNFEDDSCSGASFISIVR